MLNPEMDFRKNKFDIYDEILEKIIEKYRGIIEKNSFSMQINLPINFTSVHWYSGEKFEDRIPNNCYTLKLTEAMQCNILNDGITFKYNSM
ncbi:MAG: hypothetical protein WAW59_05950 [Patescibacteria group bacterium]